ncbi:MAG: rod shape-determining protein MreD [Firmicutes bacterium]|nr:rod shape-determining protein MreD [Bacillota bacterium]
MKYVVYWLLLMLALVLQTAGSPGILFFGFKPEILLLVTLLFAMLLDSPTGAIFGFMAGLMQDLVVGRFVTLYATCLMLMAIVVGFVTRRFYRENFIVRFFSLFLGTALTQILYLLGAASFGLSRTWTLDTWQAILMASIFNGLVGMLLFRPLAALNKRLVYLDELVKRTG